MDPSATETAYIWMIAQGVQPWSAEAVKCALRDEIAERRGVESRLVQDTFEDAARVLQRIEDKDRADMWSWAQQALARLSASVLELAR